ncbi:hypothetical protein EJ06DRAFT_219367 [Trichodelitschia bisporula]|uniref:Uncharacterized protein n=1 Tax=Trichodelitschia bisporula TaxID=703511 RepID=A0A6G1I9N5_9PEZI|nr:hypothetical protein EJ06DRAFT_219367 [Trichodelitschia bisporula]
MWSCFPFVAAQHGRDKNTGTASSSIPFYRTGRRLAHLIPYQSPVTPRHIASRHSDTHRPFCLESPNCHPVPAIQEVACEAPRHHAKAVSSPHGAVRRLRHIPIIFATLSIYGVRTDVLLSIEDCDLYSAGERQPFANQPCSSKKIIMCRGCDIICSRE